MRTLSLVVTLLAVACASEGSPSMDEPLDPEVEQRLADLGPLPPLPADPTNRFADDPAAQQLGHWLFYDQRLSRHGDVSCATCHRPDHAFAEPEAIHPGLVGGRHTPSALDAGHQRWLFWDGRADSTWSQALGPWENPKEHDGSRLQFAHLVNDDAELNAAYTQLFGPLPDLSDLDRFPPLGGPLSSSDEERQAWQAMDPADQDLVTEIFVNLGKAVAAFERILTTGPAPIDAFAEALQRGERTDGLISSDAEAGARLFVGDAGCHFCHAGPLLSNREFHNLGLSTNPNDQGRFSGIESLLSDPFNAAGLWSDDPALGTERLRFLAKTAEQLGQFKTPSLRLAALTPPYMHDGSLATLEEVLDFYDELHGAAVIGHREETLVALELTPTEKRQLLAFLETLSPELPPASLLVAPASPSVP